LLALQPGVLRDPFSRSPSRPFEPPVKISYSNPDDEKSQSLGKKAFSAFPRPTSRAQEETTRVRIWRNDDKSGEKRGSSSTLGGASSASTPKKEENGKEDDKYHAPGALGWYVHVPQSLYGNHFIPVIPRLKEKKEPDNP